MSSGRIGFGGVRQNELCRLQAELEDSVFLASSGIAWASGSCSSWASMSSSRLDVSGYSCRMDFVVFKQDGLRCLRVEWVCSVARWSA